MIYLFVFLVGLNVVDIISTYIILKNGGREINFVIQKIMDKLGVLWGLILAKSCALILLFTVTFIVGIHWVLYIVYVTVIILYGGVVVHNLKNIK